MPLTYLLFQRRFLPFFLTQFFGAMNDNFFKTVILISLTLIAAEQAGVWSNLAHLAFVLPFFLFSAASGFYADQVEKSQWIQTIKLFEILIMLLGAVCLWYDWLWGLMVLLFLMGFQSTLFGPVKYSIIPQHLSRDNLTRANAWVELGTFLAILLGNMWAGFVFELSEPKLVICVCLVVFALVGYVSSRSIPLAPSEVREDESPIKLGTFALVRRAMAHRNLFFAMLGVSWFWFLGSAYLTQLPVFTSQYLSSSESVISLFLIAFSVGVGFGSLLCSWLSAGKIEIGLVPLGALGLSVFGGALAMVPPMSGVEIDIASALNSAVHWNVFFILIGLGASGGLYIVPLYGMIQTLCPQGQRAQMIAANNIVNALLMVLAAVYGLVTLGLFDFSLDQFFWGLVVLNCAVAVFIFSVVPEFVARLGVWCLVHIMYRVKQSHVQESVPEEGPAVIVANHVSFVDALIIGGLVRRPTRCMMDRSVYDLPVLNFIFGALGAIPVDSKQLNPQMYEAAFESVASALEQGELVVLFPEGEVTRDGDIAQFNSDLLKIVQRNPVPVVPMALNGLWGRCFSRKGGNVMTKRAGRWCSPVSLSASPAWHVQGNNGGQSTLDLEALRAEVVRLRDQTSR